MERILRLKVMELEREGVEVGKFGKMEVGGVQNAEGVVVDSL